MGCGSCAYASYGRPILHLFAEIPEHNRAGFRDISNLLGHIADGGTANIFVNGAGPVGIGSGQGGRYETDNDDRRTFFAWWGMMTLNNQDQYAIEVRDSDLPKEYDITLKDPNQREDDVSYSLTVNARPEGAGIIDPPTVTIRRKYPGLSSNSDCE